MDFSESVRVAGDLPDTLGPLVADIDGTLTNDDRAIDPLVFPVVRAWPAPVIIATGKAMPYPVALCDFFGIEVNVIAENGGVALAGRAGEVEFVGDPEAVSALVEAYRAQGHDLGWGGPDLVNRWRETEIAVSRESPLQPLETLAGEHGLEVIDSGYAYHVKSPDQTKGRALSVIADQFDYDRREYVAVGDSMNDVSTFEEVGTSVAVANADDDAKHAADHVTAASFGDGFLEAIQWIVTELP